MRLYNIYIIGVCARPVHYHSDSAINRPTSAGPCKSAQCQLRLDDDVSHLLAVWCDLWYLTQVDVRESFHQMSPLERGSSLGTS